MMVEYTQGGVTYKKTRVSKNLKKNTLLLSRSYGNPFTFETQTMA